MNSPDKLFERRWALTILHATYARLEEEYLGDRRPLFQQLRGLLADDSETKPYAEIARQLGMTEAAVKKAAQRLRSRYQELIRQEIAHTVVTSSQIEDELRYLRAALST